MVEQTPILSSGVILFIGLASSVLVVALLLCQFCRLFKNLRNSGETYCIRDSYTDAHQLECCQKGFLGKDLTRYQQPKYVNDKYSIHAFVVDLEVAPADETASPSPQSDWPEPPPPLEVDI